MDNETKKKVDESWKNQVAKEKQKSEEKKQQHHEPTFSIFLSSLSLQTMIALGKIENPATSKSEPNLEHARFLIDTLGIIAEKTKGNLTPEESTFLQDALFNLRTIYIKDNKAT